MSNEKQNESEERIAELAQELAEAINESKAAGRTEARDFAIDVLKEEVDTEVIAGPEPRPDGERPGSLNPFGLGIPFLLLGVLLLPLFGLVGLAISAIGAFMCVVGVAMAITGSRKKTPPEGG